MSALCLSSSRSFVTPARGPGVCRSRPRGGAGWWVWRCSPVRAGGACGPRLARSPAPSSWLGSRRGPRRWPLPGPGRGGAAARWRCARGARAVRRFSQCPSPSLGLAWAARARDPALAGRVARWCGCAGSGRAPCPLWANSYLIGDTAMRRIYQFDDLNSGMSRTCDWTREH